MGRQYVNSFADYARAKGINIKPRNSEVNTQQVKCLKCGTPMDLVGNVLICPNLEVKKEVNGKEVIEPCGNFIIQEIED